MMQTAKKSKSSPAVGGQVPPQFIQESPSTGVLATKHSGGPAQTEEQQQQQAPAVVAVAAAAASQEPSSTLSELSSVSSEQTEPTSNNTATTGTLTTTSDEITAISRIDDRGGAGEEPSLGAGAPTEAENQTDHELNELETTNNDDVTVSETEPQPVSVREPPHDAPPQEEDEPVGPAEGAAGGGDGGGSVTAGGDDGTLASDTEREAGSGAECGESSVATGDEPAEPAEDLAKQPPARVEAAEVYQIVDAIRKATRLSHELSCVALRVVLAELEVLLPPAVVRHLEPVAVHLAAPFDVPDGLLSKTHDAHRLRLIFAELSDCKNDSEQRTWMLHEDEADIRQYLAELIRILTDADPKICRSEMACDQYQSIINLVLYYQMETRWSIRKLLLAAFRAMCHLDYTTVDILLGSVLPLELVQDMVSNPRNIEKLQELANMLIIIFSIGRRMPINQQGRVLFLVFWACGGNFF